MADTHDGDNIRARLMAAVPVEIRKMRIFLLWKSRQLPGEKKPRKIPFYAGGGTRDEVQGSAEDREQLVDFDTVMLAFDEAKHAGIGIAPQDDGALAGIDIDNCVTNGTVVPEIMQQLVVPLGSYTEISPSGNGIRILAFCNTLSSRKRIHPAGYNVEFFRGSGFVTLTGRNVFGDTVEWIKPEVQKRLEQWLDADDGAETHTRMDHLRKARDNDPVYLALKAKKMIIRDCNDGKSDIHCPFESEHSGASGDSSTSYFLAHTNTYAKAHFKCMHAHCAHRKDADFMLALGVHEPDFDALLGKRTEPNAPAVHTTIDWQDVVRNPPKPRVWAVDNWLAIGSMSVLAGRGGIGKTLIMQQLGSCISKGHEFLGAIETPRKVLQWCAEDDAEELKRRQIAIAEWMQVPIQLFQGSLYVEPLAGVECSLADLVSGTLVATKHTERLWQQINDLHIGVFMLDNIAHLYGGNENDRHQVTKFMNVLTGMCLTAGCAGVLAGHPAKSSESEFSGSTAWENAVRSRFYLSRTPDGAKEEDAEQDSAVRYLSRRKANYSNLDSVRLTYLNGVLQPDIANVSDSPLIRGIVDRKARRVVCDAVRKLADMQQFCGCSSQGGNFLPKVIRKFQLSEGVHMAELEKAMRQLMVDGELVMGVVGKKANRQDRLGLVLK